MKDTAPFSVFFHHIRQASIERHEPLKETLLWVKSLGYRFAEVDADDLNGTELLAEAGMGVSNICRFYPWQTSANTAKMEEHIQIAQHLGCGRVMPIPGFYSESGDRAEEAKRMLDGMYRFAQNAEKAGLTAVIEDFDDIRSPISTVAGMQSFLGPIPELRVTLDTGNFIYSGEDVLTALKQLQTRIAHVHLKDRLWTRTGSGEPKSDTTGRVLWPCAVGSGDLPITEVLKALQQEGYQGCLTVEHFGAASYAEAIRSSAQYLHRMGY